MILHPLAERYLSRLRVEGGLSLNTIEAYRRDLSKFHSYLHRIGMVPVGSLTSETLTGFLRFMQEARLSRASSLRCLSAIRGWLQFLMRERIIEENPTIGLVPISRGVRLPKTLSQQDVTALLDLGAVPTPEDLRDRAMVELLYATGLRVSELVMAEVALVNLDVGYLRVTGKGAKQRLVPMGERARQLLEQYVDRGAATAAQKTGVTVRVCVEAGRAVDTASLLEVATTPCTAGRDHADHFAAHASAFVCDASARRRCGSSVCSGHARPCRILRQRRSTRI